MSSQTIEFNASEELPQAKYNSVAFMKSESIAYSNRQFIQVSEIYICYIVRGNILRIIDSRSGSKSILKGHTSSITDVTFSSLDASLLYSCDIGTDTSISHIYVWQLLDTSSEVEFNTVATYKFPATIIKTHPVMKNVSH
jgi:WD40 repeat protein